MGHRERAWASASILATAFVGQAVWAQTAPPAAPAAGQLEEVVVTAQKRSERLAKVPLPVQAISGKELARQGVTTSTDLVRLVPSASVVSSTATGFDTIEIRGISSGTTGDSLVGYYLDDTPFGIPNLQLSPPSRLLDVSQVEIIRGPSGTIYGQGSSGGTVKIITNKPNLETYSGSIGSEFSGTQGGGINYETDFMLNAPLIRDVLGLRVTGSYENLGGYAHLADLHQDNVNDAQLKNIRAAVRWQPTPDITVDGLYWHIENSQPYNNNLTPANAPAELKSTLTAVYGAEGLGALAPYFAGLSTDLAYPVQPVGTRTIAGIDGVRGFTNVDADIYSLDVNWNTDIGTVTSNSSYIQHKLFFSDPVVGYLVDNSDFKTNSFTDELRLASASDSPIHYLIGAAYRDATIHSDIDFFADERIFFLPGVKEQLIDIVGPLQTKSYAVFGEVSAPLFGGLLEPLFGIRYFNDDRNAVTLERNTGFTDSGSANFNSVSPRFNLKLNVADNGIFFFNAAKGFRSGTLQTAAQVAEANAQGIPATAVIRPDTLWTYELGTRWQFLDNTLAFETSVYHTDWKDVQIEFNNSAGSVSVVNGGNARINGVDALARWNTPVAGLSLSAEGGYLDARFSSINPLLALATAVREGGALPNVPRATATFSADYQRHLPQLDDAVLSFDGSFAYRSDQIDPASGLRSSDVRDLSLRASLQKGPYRGEIFALNALNDSGPVVRQLYTYQILYPRQVGLRLSYSF
jgi:outer membrane receptor protein involved in Fe transport